MTKIVFLRNVYKYYNNEIMFTWDGSDLTDLIKNHEILGFKVGKIKYWIFRFPQPNNKEVNIVTVISRTCRNSLSCIIDELKPLFGIPKLGTHRVTIDNKMYQLIRAPLTKEGVVKVELNLADLPNVTSELFIKQVQEVFTFRELLGVSWSYESNINIRVGNHMTYPISFYEPAMHPENPEKVVPNNVLQKWFVDVTMDEVTRRIIKVKDEGDITNRVMMLRSQIEKVIERVDKQAIMYADYITARVINRLQASF